MKQIKSLLFLPLLILVFLGWAPWTHAFDSRFDDLKGLDAVSVEYLAERGMLHGYPDGTFGLSNGVKRAELVKLMVTMQGIDPDPEVYKDCFLDVQDQWFAKYVCKAKEEGWIVGYPDGYFRPGDFVSDIELLKMVLTPFFGDVITVSSNSSQKWYEPYVDFAVLSRIALPHEIDVYGYSQWYPTRLEMADIVFKTLLISENDLDLYHDFYRDQILDEEGYSYLVSELKNCYVTDQLRFDFYTEYLKSQYHIDPSNTDFYSSFDSYSQMPESSPFFDTGSFCLLDNGDYLFSVLMSNQTSNESSADVSPEAHLIRFDSSGTLTSDQSAVCSDSNQAYSLIDFSYSDLNSLELIDCRYVKDGRQVYFLESPIEGALPDSFELIESEFFDGLYSKDAHHVYYQDKLLPGSDPATFTILEKHYANDASNVYYYDRLIDEADTETFEVVHTYPFETCCLYTNDAFDKDSFFVNGSTPSWFDEDTELLFGPFFVKKDSYVYYNFGNKIEPLDSVTETLNSSEFDSFELIDEVPVYPGSWARTADKIFLMSVHLIEVTDADSFEFIDEVYSKDKYNVFHLKRWDSGWQFLDIPGADPLAFVRLSKPGSDIDLAKDDAHVFYALEALDTKDLDVHTAEFIEAEYVLRDANGYTCDLETGDCGL